LGPKLIIEDNNQAHRHSTHHIDIVVKRVTNISRNTRDWYPNSIDAPIAVFGQQMPVLKLVHHHLVLHSSIEVMDGLTFAIASSTRNSIISESESSPMDAFWTSNLRHMGALIPPLSVKQILIFIELAKSLFLILLSELHHVDQDLFLSLMDHVR
jgi:hypothetical protein